MSTDSDGKKTDKRLGRMTVFRGLAGDKAIDDSAQAIAEASEDNDSDAGAPPTPNDSDKGAKQRGTDASAKPPATDSDKASKRETDQDRR